MIVLRRALPKRIPMCEVRRCYCCAEPRGAVQLHGPLARCVGKGINQQLKRSTIVGMPPANQSPGTRKSRSLLSPHRDEMAAALFALVAASWLPGPPGCPASPRRPSGVHAPQQSAFRMTSTPPREMDPRGFVVPQVGDVVKVPSKWPGEWDVAQVDFVQFVSSRQAYEVDLLPLKSVGQSMYRLPGRKPAAVRADVAKLSRLAATYVRASDAYQIDEAELQPLGGTRRSSVLKVPPLWRHSLLPRPPRTQADGSGPLYEPGRSASSALRTVAAHGAAFNLRQRRSCCASQHPGQRTPT